MSVHHRPKGAQTVTIERPSGDVGEGSAGMQAKLALCGRAFVRARDEHAWLVRMFGEGFEMTAEAARDVERLRRQYVCIWWRLHG